MKNKAIIEFFEDKLSEYEMFADRIQSYITRNTVLKKNVHSFKRRTKDLTHLDKKIDRKNEKLKASGSPEINSENAQKNITDIIGIRVLHLHQGQFDSIHKELMTYVERGDIFLYETPKAYTWDPEYAKYFKSLDIITEEKESFYTSVHYVFKASEKSDVTCEVQVRTLLEEVWGEIDHAVNYPEENENQIIKEQLKIFARIVGAGTGMSHSILKIHESKL